MPQSAGVDCHSHRPFGLDSASCKSLLQQLRPKPVNRNWPANVGWSLWVISKIELHCNLRVGIFRDEEQIKERFTSNNLTLPPGIETPSKLPDLRSLEESSNSIDARHLPVQLDKP